MSAEPIRRIRESDPEPAGALRAEIDALCDLLVVRPLPRRAALRGRALSALAACEAIGDTGLATHLLRNLLRDLATEGGLVDASYYAVQLDRAVGRLAG